MQLYTSPTTPFGRKVAVMILESGLSDRVTLTTVGGTPLDPGTLPVGRNPLGKIPALVTDTGQTLFDSRVICRYLDDLSGAGLYPKGADLWPVLTQEALADGVLEAALLMVYESRLRPEEARFAPWIEAQWAKIARALDAVENGSPLSLGGALTMGQIAMGCALGYLDFRLDARNWRQGRPVLSAWAQEFDGAPFDAIDAACGLKNRQKLWRIGIDGTFCNPQAQQKPVSHPPAPVCPLDGADNLG